MLEKEHKAITFAYAYMDKIKEIKQLLISHPEIIHCKCEVSGETFSELMKQNLIMEMNSKPKYQDLINDLIKINKIIQKNENQLINVQKII